MRPHLAVFAALALSLAACGDQGPDTPRAVAASIDMVPLPGGRFVMGTDETEGLPQGFPAHPVTVKPIAVSRYEVTFDQYDAFARATKLTPPDDAGWGRGKHPAINVNYEDVQAFIAWLNRSGRRFRLPSEAEWEYAARGGTTTRYWWGDAFDAGRLNTSLDQGADRWPGTAPVGSFPANPFGLHDTAGNVWEWTADCGHYSYVGAPVDGSARTEPSCNDHTIRGGSWFSATRAATSTGRALGANSIRSKALGFRLVEDR